MTFNVNSLFNSVAYRIGATLIDCGDEFEGFKGVRHVLLTHAHFDHIYGLNRLLEMNPGALIYTNLAGGEMLLDAKKNLSKYHDVPFVLSVLQRIVTVYDGQKIELGEGVFAEAVFTPGHNPSCITWVIGDALFTGDSYIPGTKTVTNLPLGDKAAALQSEQKIKILSLNRTIYPGHRVLL